MEILQLCSLRRRQTVTYLLFSQRANLSTIDPQAVVHHHDDDMKTRTKTRIATTETVVIAPVSGKEHRASRRVMISRPLLVRPSDPKYKEEVQVTLNTSRNGLYFRTQAKHYHVGMRVSVILGYIPNEIPRLSGRLFGLTGLRMAASELQST
jgi:hypothetical protein